MIHLSDAYFRHYLAGRCEEDGEAADCPYCEQEADDDE